MFSVTKCARLTNMNYKIVPFQYASFFYFNQILVLSRTLLREKLFYNLL